MRRKDRLEQLEDNNGGRPGWQGVPRRGLRLGQGAISVTTLAAAIGLLVLLGSNAPSWEIAAGGVALGLLLAATIGSAVFAARVRAHDSRARGHWQELTRHRPGGALWKRRERIQRTEMPGWKIARVIGEPVPQFVGLAFGSYGPVQDAVCAHADHAAPDPLCTCGFYAFYRPLHARWAWWRNRESVLLHVEGYGLAVEHELGWRAGHQEILTVVLPRRCLYCPRRTSGLIRTPLFNEWTAACTGCAQRKKRDLHTPEQLSTLWGTQVSVARSWRWGWSAPKLHKATPTI